MKSATSKARPDQPLEGIITIEPDLPPGIAARTKTTIVLPNGSPNVHYEAADDHALGQIWLTWEAVAGDAEVRQADHAHMVPEPDTSAGTAAAAPEKREGRIEVCRFPPEAATRSREADFRLPLAVASLEAG